MAPPKPAEMKRRYFSVEEANKTLPLVRAIVSDIVRQFNVVNDLKQRLSAVISERKRPSSDPTTIPTADCPKSARNRTSPPGTATSLSVRSIDDMDTGAFPGGRRAARSRGTSANHIRNGAVCTGPAVRRHRPSASFNTFARRTPAFLIWTSITGAALS